ncbi:MAG TPA: lysylphosphatidylglycerol synthase transmembrane domain-containing protein [Gemmatimonadales bacterium]|nr:lysylphosphatidylglycerol synthase transmembrane domain-containing protein [Gemmatimonadales bacterium]
MAATLVSAAFLAWALHDVSFADLGRHLRSARLGWMVAAVGVATLTFPIRALRWRWLLHDDAGIPIRTGAAWHAVALGFAANNVLPLRAGELVRVWVASRLGGVRLTAALSSVVVERVLDGLTLVGLLALALLLPGLPPDVSMWGMPVARIATLAGVVFGGAFVIALLLVLHPLPAERLVVRLAPARLAGRVVGLLEGLRHGLSALASPGRLAGAVAWSIVLWLVNGASFALAFRAFDLPVPASGALLLQGVLAFGIAIPTAPGYVGVFELVIRAVLQLYGVPPGRGVSYAIAYHVTTFLPVILLGAWSLWRTPVAFHDLTRPPTGG